MDDYSKYVLTIIAASLVIIAANLSVSTLALRPPVFADLVKIHDMEDSESQEREYEKLLASIPLIYVHKGSIDAEITGGTVEVTGNVGIDK